MATFEYLGLEFEPYRNLDDEERRSFHEATKPWDRSPEDFDHGDFYAAARAAGGEDFVVDLFRVDGNVVLPASRCLFLYKDSLMPEHYNREKSRKLSASALLQLIDPTGIDGFYPTPDDLVHEMVVGLDWCSITSVLEPSAGKGDLVDSLLKWRSIATCRHDDYCGFHVDCIEINPDLRAVLRGKNYRVIHDDFMTFRSAKRYDLIIMNPDFRVADKHLLKALDMQAHGGMVICLLNAATLKNPCTRMRQQLVDRLNALDAEVTYYDNAFTDAERPTSVSVAMVKVVVPQAKAERSDIFERMKKAVEAEEYAPEDIHDLAPAEFMERFVRMFDVEVAAGVELIRQYNAMWPHMLSSIPDSVIAGI